MEYTFEITVAGCNARCRHCYVSGGPGSSMPLSDYRACLEKLVPALTRLKGNVSIAPGHEPFNHEEAAALMRMTHALAPQFYPDAGYDWPTTGIALKSRRDRADIFALLHGFGAKRLMLTLHGLEECHNEIVRAPHGFEALCAFADLLHAEEFEVAFNLMLNHRMTEDWDAICQVLEANRCDVAYLTIPLYLPVARLRKYEPYRATYADCQRLRGRLDRFGIDEAQFFAKVEAFNAAAVRARALQEGWDYAAREREKPDWAFFHITEELEFYYGNAGMHTKRLGNIATMTSEEIYEAIQAQRANYDYSAYYDLKQLPHISAVLAANPPQENHVYPDAESCLYRWLDAMGVPTILLPGPGALAGA